MSTSMISTVLEIEREAEAILANADKEVEKILAEAKSRRETASKNHAEGVQKEVRELETLALGERSKKVKELTAAGEASLSAVRNISDAAFSGGIRHIMDSLSGK